MNVLLLKDMTKSKIKVFSPSYGSSGWLLFDHELTRNPKEADLAIFPGGADINPALYGQKANPRTSWWDSNDELQIAAYEALPKECLKFGICRGLQLLCALSGGKLIQDVTNHVGGNHNIVTIDDINMPITSCHHQMIFPYNLSKEDYQILAWADPSKSSHYFGETNENIELPDNFVEIEMCWFPKTNCLGVQGHPEWMSERSSVVRYLNDLILEKLNK